LSVTVASKEVHTDAARLAGSRMHARSAGRARAQAADACAAHTGAGAAYVGAVEDGAQARQPWASAAADPATAAHAEGAEEEEEDEERAAEPADEEAAALLAAGAGAAAPQRVLEYVAASAGQGWMLAEGAVLHAPPAPAAPEDGESAPGDEGGVPPQASADRHPPCLRMLADGAAELSIDNVAYDAGTVFLRRFPRVGALHAVALRAGGGGAHALLCADTLLPQGSGRPLADGDRRASQPPVSRAPSVHLLEISCLAYVRGACAGHTRRHRLGAVKALMHRAY
jgi:hypothetical protein